MLARHLLLIVVVTSATFFTQLGSSKLWDRDEPRNARCALEMLQRGDWIVPTFNDELRTHKPILLYWLTMVSYSVFGVSEFTARMPSASLAMATVLLTYLIACRLFNPVAALWSALVLASTLMFTVAARAATPDATLIFCGTLALCFFVYSIPRRQWLSADPAASFAIWSLPAAICIYAAMGLAVLAKGPVGLVLPTAVIGMFLLIARLPTREGASTLTLKARVAILLRPFAPRHFLITCYEMRPITAVLTVAAVAVPWYIMVGLKTDGAWLRGFFLEHNVSRAMAPMEGHDGSILFYPAALLVGFFPWSVLAIPTGLWARAELRHAHRFLPVTFLLCWIGVYVGAFSLAQTKLPSYVTPTYPAIAILCGGYLHTWLQDVREPDFAKFWPQISMMCLATVGGVIAIALPIAAHVYLPGEEWLGIAGAFPLLGGIVGWLAVRRQHQAHAARALAVASVCTIVVAFGIIAPRVSQHQQVDRLIARTGAPSSPQKIASFAALEPSWIFYARQPITFFRRGQKTEAVDFLLSDPSAFLITTQRQLDQLQPLLPSQTSVLETVPYFLRDENLVLLRCGPQLTQAARDHRTTRQ